MTDKEFKEFLKEREKTTMTFGERKIVSYFYKSRSRSEIKRLKKLDYK